MRFARPLFVLAALGAAAACADGTARITAPDAPSRTEEGGGLMGSGTVTTTSESDGGTDSGGATPAEPTDTTSRSGGWAGSGN